MRKTPRQPTPAKLLITCEHAGRRVPPRFAALFTPHADLLATHRGYDLGARPLARAIAGALHAPYLEHDTTRLLADVNRSPHNPNVFSEISRVLPRAQRLEILTRYHTPHRYAVRAAVESLLTKYPRVIHIGIHTFTPVLRGKVRNVGVGLLYDPARTREKQFCAKWKSTLVSGDNSIRVRMNNPYRGNADGLTTTLRKQFKPEQYLGVELEINQGMLNSSRRFPTKLTQRIIESLRQAISG